VGHQESLTTNFGLLIAYVLPGFTALQGVPLVASPPAEWGAAAPGSTLTGFLSGTLAALAAGLTVSTARWVVIDTLHHRTGLRPPAWDFALLAKNVQAFALLVDIHYRYYKFYANMVVALAWAYATRGYTLGWRGSAYWGLAALFFLGSRDALRKYYDRAGRLLGARPPAVECDL
jgi:hypothetical protein